MHRNAAGPGIALNGGMWKPAATAPFNRRIELAVIDRTGAHALVFACRRVADGWINAETMKPVVVHPTHWRPWPEAAAAGVPRSAKGNGG
jgi:hypothetical protein